MNTYPIRTLRLLRRSAAFVTVAVIATGILALGGATPTAQAADDTGSAVTVKWAGGNDTDIQQYQPDHAALSDGKGNDGGLGHWNDFKDLRATVSKTKNLGNEVVDVEVTGFTGPSILGGNGKFLDSNFVQAMQCWGPDPLAADFAETCQFGSWGETKGSQGGRLNRGGHLAPETEIGFAPQPFRAVTGEVSKPERVNGYSVTGIERFFREATSNEIPLVPVDDKGTTRFRFEVQSATAQPYLGCGNPASAASNRCWLVLVPRGVYSGEWPAAQSTGYPCDAWNPIPAGTKLPYNQTGSPIGAECSFFANRIVVPLDFADTTPACPAGSAERRIIGTEAIADAFSSWQSALCAQNGALYNLATNSGDLTRAQLLARQADFAIVSAGVNADTIGLADPALLEGTDFRYAPVANTALTFGFVIASPTTTVTDIKLTPRLIAKLLTQSYRVDVPDVTARPGDVVDVFDDPEWAALGNSPRWPRMTSGFIVVTPGPHGDDAIAQLWAYLQSDADAAAFLRGQPDPWGMTVNPYYLPAGNPAAKGGGLSLDLSREPSQSFLRADQTTVYGKIDSVAWSPYANSFGTAASRVVRFDSQRTRTWDPNANNGAGGLVPDSVQLLVHPRTFLAPMVASVSADYRLPTASIAAPLAETTTADTVKAARSFITATPESMAAAIGAQTVDGKTGIGRVDFAKLPGGAYPLTFTANAAVDLASPKLDEAARADYAGLLRYVADDGQQPGERPGQLPAGYVPLTEQQRGAARTLADQLMSGAANLGTQPNNGASKPAVNAAAAQQDSPGAVGPQTQVGAREAAEAETTGTTGAPAQAVLGASLAAAVAGLLGAPLLLRRRMGGL